MKCPQILLKKSLKEKEDNMDLNEIKEILGNGGGKIVIVENGKPTMVILSYGEYKSGNPRIQALKSESEPSSFESQASEELTVDDLPL